MNRDLFLENKYTNWYFSIIENRKNNELPKDTYSENHHIIPKSFGGDNSKLNLVRLSAREHFLVHWILTKVCKEKEHGIKMKHALLRMMCASEALETHKWSKWQYEIAKIKKSAALKEARKNGNDPRLGKKHSPEAKEKMRKAKLGVKRNPEACAYLKTRPITDETRKKISEALTGRVFSEESRKKSSNTQKGKSQNKTKSICYICGHETYATQIKRYHNDNCKLKANIG